jgi:hypothetical protein
MNLLILPLMLLLAFNQDKTPVFQIQPNPLEPGNCETNRVMLTEIAYVAKKLDEKEIVVAIVRLGKGELPIMNKRRLYTIKAYLELPPDKLVTAEGEPTNGYGVVEFYIKGKPYLVLALGKNKELEVGDCMFEFEKTKFYMPKNAGKKRAK